MILTSTAMVLGRVGSWSWASWGWLVVPIAIYCIITLGLFAAGHSDEPFNFMWFFFHEVSDSLERATGLAGWAMAGALSGLLMLGIAVMGFYWDVAWHIDFGRDKDLFTPSHVMIIVGLGGLVYAAGVTVLFASIERVRTRLRIGPVRIPLAAVVLAMTGIGGVAAFPLDALWHEAYGIDVTLWSPTHLQLMSGGALGTLAIWLIIASALRHGRPNLLGRGIHVLAAGAVLTGLSIYQAEFDYTVPQFQLVYLPIIVLVAGAFTLVAARIALGRWGAVKAVTAYLVLRGLLALMVGGALGHTVPRFSLYLPSALLVEAAAALVGTRQRLRFGLVAGALVGTVGLVAEMAWWGVIGDSTVGGSFVPRALLLAPLAAVGAAVLGAGFARAFVAGPQAHEGPAADPAARPRHAGVPAGALALAGVVVLVLLAVPLPRNVGRVDAEISTQQQGDRALVGVTLQPADAADHAIAFEVTGWQGGGTVHAALEKVSPGRYRTTEAVPVTGKWKAMVTLERGDQVMAAPVYLPADPGIGAPAVPVLPLRRVAFTRNTAVLLREQHPGPDWPSVLAYSGLALLVAVWAGLIALTAVRLSDEEEAGGPDGAAPHSPPLPPDAEPTAPSIRPPERELAAWGWYGAGGSPGA